MGGALICLVVFHHLCSLYRELTIPYVNISVCILSVLMGLYFCFFRTRVHL